MFRARGKRDSSKLIDSRILQDWPSRSRPTASHILLYLIMVLWCTRPVHALQIAIVNGRNYRDYSSRCTVCHQAQSAWQQSLRLIGGRRHCHIDTAVYDCVLPTNYGIHKISICFLSHVLTIRSRRLKNHQS